MTNPIEQLAALIRQHTQRDANGYHVITTSPEEIAALIMRACSSARNVLGAVPAGDGAPLRHLLVSREQLREQIAADPDLPCEAGASSPGPTPDPTP